jgi:drug/metabolite transporter (DMT)-like permease
MQTWHLLIAGYVVLVATAQYLGKIFVHKIHPYQILFYQYISSLITISTYIALLKPESIFSDVPLWFIGIGFLYGIGISSNYHAKKQSLSKTRILANATYIIAIILAIIFLGEYKLLSFDSWGGIKILVGIALTIVALIFFYQKNNHQGSEESFDYKIWIKWISVYILVVGFARFIVKYAVNFNEPLLVAEFQYIGSFIIILILCITTHKNLRIGWKNMWGSLLIGVVRSSAMAAIYTALSMSTATQVFSIAPVASTIIVVLLGVFAFKEKITKRMILPFILGLIAIYLLK